MFKDFKITSKNTRTAPITVLQTLQSAATTTGNGTALNVVSKDTVGIQIFGTTTSATIVFEASVDTDPDTTHWVPVPSVKYATTFDVGNGATITSTPNEIYEVSVTPVAQLRARISAIGNGNVTILALGVS